MINREEFENILEKKHTAKVQNKIKNAKVAIAGLGGLGSNIAVLLARIGIGKLFLVDFDIVDISNINRQSYFISDIGMYKTSAIKKQLLKINPYIEIEIKTIKITSDNVVEIFKDYEFVCEAFDEPDYKAMMVEKLLLNTNCKIVSSSGMAGYFSSNLINTKKVMSRLYICGDGENGIKEYSQLMSPRVMICAGHQSNMILRLILGIEEV